MNIPVIPPKNVILQPEIPAVTAIVNTVDIIVLSDDLSSVISVVKVDGVTKTLTLWGAETTPTYEEIGNWTQEQANTRIVELI